MQQGRRPRTRLLLIVVSLVVSLGVAEIIARCLPSAEYASPTLEDPSGRVLGSLYDIVGLLRQTGVGSADGPTTRMAPNLRIQCCYDRPRWSYFDARGCILYQTNHLGYRDEEFAVEPGPDELRVLAIGDSFTFGVGVRLEDCWVQCLERALAGRLRRTVQVVNGGFVAGHRPDQYADWLVERGLRLDPDVVLIGFCLNDMGQVPMVIHRPVEFEPILGGTSRLVTLVQRLFAERRVARESAEERLDFGPLIRAQPDVWERTKLALRSMREQTAARGIRFVVAVFPMVTRLDGGYPFTSLHAMVREFCDQEGIEVIDLLDRFVGKDERDLWAHPTDQHPNDVGHALIAAGLVEPLAR